MMILTISTIFILILLIAIPVLQVFLSRTDAPWPGLILPGISLLSSLVPLLNPAPPVDPLNLLLSLLISNIPTLILLAVYGVCRDRRNRKKRSELNKMNIQDLD